MSTPTLFETIMTAVGSLVTHAVSVAGSYLDLITGNTVLLMFCIALPLVGLGAGIIRRIVRIRA